MTKKQAWDFAIGLVQIDGIKPSDEFLKLVEQEIKGEITDKEIKKFLYEKYAVKENKTEQLE